MIVIVISKITGMLRDVVLANYFGTTNISDAYLIAATVPTSIFFIIGHSLGTVYIPLYDNIKADKGVGAAQSFSNNLLNCALLLCSAIVLLLFLCTDSVVKIFAAGFDETTAQIASRLIKISAPSIYLMCIVNILGGYLQIHKNFLAPAAISLPRNFAVVVSVVVSASWGIDWLGIGLLLAYVLEVGFLLPAVLQKGYRYRAFINLRDDDLQQAKYLVTPVLIGVCVSRINKIVDRSMASTIIEGGISALTYASIINTAIQEILVTGLITILFASCAELVARNEIDQVKKKLRDTLAVISTLLIPGCVGVLVLAEPIVELILCRGEFDQHSLHMTTGALRCYTMGLLFLAVRDTLVKVFYAFKETKTTTTVSIASIVLNIILNIVLGQVIGIHGLALATSLSAIFNSIVLFVLLYKRIGDFGIAKISSVMVKSAVGSVAMGAGTYYSYQWLAERLFGLVAVLITVACSCILYMAIELMLNNEAVWNMIGKNNSKM